MLINERGDVSQSASGGLRQHYHAPLSSQSLPDFLVRSGSHIELKIQRDSLAVRAVPARVSTACYAKAARIVQQHAFNRATLTWLDGSWKHEFFRDGMSAMRRLMALMLDGNLIERAQFRAEGRHVDSLERSDPLGDVISVWRDRGGELSIASARDVLNTKLDAKYSVVARDTESGTLKFQEFGPGLSIYSNRGNMSICLGKAVQDQPDYHYGRWIAEGYRDAFLANEPLVTDMDVVVGDPLHGEQRRLQYRRLTLPVRSSDGALALLSAVCVDPRINLGFEVHHEVK